MVMPVSVCMEFKTALLHLIYLTYLVLLISQFAHQQGSTPCRSAECGLNGICRVSGNSSNCSCPPGFQFVVKDKPLLGCRPTTFPNQSCSSSGAIMHTVKNVDFWGNDYADLLVVNASDCKEKCLEDCFCTVAVYKNVTGYGEHCYMKLVPMMNGREDRYTTVFVKVYSGVYDTVSLTSSKQRKAEKGKWLGVVGISLMGCSFGFGAILLFIWLCTCRPKLKALQEHHNANPVGLKAFSYQEIDAATGGFKQEIGRGGFGKVYKGVLSDGRQIAVKKLDDLVKQGGQQDGEKEFRTEMCLIGASHHKNLVQLYGFCAEGSHRLLIYQYMSNGSLDNFLFKGTRDLDWEVRVQIALGISRGILYLHEECATPILHCDIKPQNILLDENYHAKIADFGMSKLIGAEQTRTFTMARGTIGYIAPEWQKNKAVTVKVDVYSFGVVLLEIICCRKMFEMHVPENEMVLCDWVYDCFKHGHLSKLVEEQDYGGIEETHLERMVLVGLWCIQEDSSLRPSMKKVVQMLEGTVEIQVPPLPEVSSSSKSYPCPEVVEQFLDRRLLFQETV